MLLAEFSIRVKLPAGSIDDGRALDRLEDIEVDQSIEAVATRIREALDDVPGVKVEVIA
jgi:hypothetical protein